MREKEIYITGAPRGPRGSQKSIKKKKQLNDTKKLFSVGFVNRMLW